MNMLPTEKLPNFITPQAFNMNNPVQAAGAARGRKSRRQYRNSVGVQHLSASCCAPTEHSVSTLYRLTPSCGYRLARGYSHSTPRIFAGEKIGSDFSTDFVFLFLNRKRIVSDTHLDKYLLYRTVGFTTILYYPTSLDKVLRDIT